jgi:hypothetical protein
VSTSDPARRSAGTEDPQRRVRAEDLAARRALGQARLPAQEAAAQLASTREPATDASSAAPARPSDDGAIRPAGSAAPQGDIAARHALGPDTPAPPPPSAAAPAQAAWLAAQAPAPVARPAEPRTIEVPTQVSVTIGRVEVRAAPAPAPAAPAPPAARPKREPPSLDDYLRARASGRAG